MSAIALPSQQRSLVTPEGVDLQVRLADAGERAAAFLLDAIIIMGTLLLLTFAVLVLGVATRFYRLEFMGVIWLLGFFLLRNFYFIGFELTPRAATPGKRIVGLRVAMRDGSPLTANAIVARNVMRELEIFLPMTLLSWRQTGVASWIVIAGLIWCAVFVFFPLFNRDRLRVGDLAGGTWVVVAPRQVLDAELGTAAGAAVFGEAALDAYGIKELNILEGVVRRKDPAVMRAVAARIRAKIKFDVEMPDEAFLSAYYVALRGRLETRLLFGRRRRDKFEKI